MLFTSLFSWWYGAGYRDQANLWFARLSRVSDRFSVSLLLKYFFSPFRQISAGSVSGPLDARVRALIDKLVSRCIGAMIRTVLIVAAGIALLLEIVMGIFRLALWPVLPVLPVVGIFLAVSGWIPWHL